MSLSADEHPPSGSSQLRFHQVRHLEGDQAPSKDIEEFDSTSKQGDLDDDSRLLQDPGTPFVVFALMYTQV